MTMTLDTRAFSALKRRAHAMNPEIPSAKLAEILSAGLGYRTHAAMLAHMAEGGWIKCEADDDRAAQRALALGVAVPADLMAALATAEPDCPFSLTASDVRDIIRLAEACNRKDAEKMRNLDGSGLYRMSQFAAVGLLEESPERTALEGRIAALTKPALLELIAVVWIVRQARTPVDADDWRAYLVNAYETHDDDTVNYIVGQYPALPRYLSRAISLIRIPN